MLWVKSKVRGRVREPSYRRMAHRRCMCSGTLPKAAYYQNEAGQQSAFHGFPLSPITNSILGIRSEYAALRRVPAICPRELRFWS